MKRKVNRRHRYFLECLRRLRLCYRHHHRQFLERTRLFLHPL